jgi:hypothetical protein
MQLQPDEALIGPLRGSSRCISEHIINGKQEKGSLHNDKPWVGKFKQQIANQ